MSLSICILALCCAPLQAEQYEAWIHEGTPLSAPDADSDSQAQLAWQLAQLVAPTLASHPANLAAANSPEAMRRRQFAALAVLNFWASNQIPLAWQDASYARLRGHIDRTVADRIVAMLLDPNLSRRTDLLNLLLAAPLPEVRQVLHAFVLDEQNPAPDRGRVAESLLLRDGRAALLAMLPAIHPQADDPFMRRLFSAWRGCVQAEDFPLLEKIATEAEGFVSPFALQLWAMKETDRVARKRIYDIALNNDPRFRIAAMNALARGGPDPGLASAFLGELDSASREMRSLARRMIPVFDSEQALLDAYLQREAGMSLNTRGQWMTDLASLSLPQGAQLAMQWLIDGGWSKGAVARNVVRYLARSEQVDSLLPTLFSLEDLPREILYPLALARAHSSADARAYLRNILPELLSGEQIQAFQVLAANGELEDLLLLRDYVTDRSKAPNSRVAALYILAAIPQAQQLLGEWREPLPQNFEVLAALIELLMLSENEEWRQWGHDQAFAPPSFFDADEARGLRSVVWRVLGQRRGPSDRVQLANYLAQHLLEIEGDFAGDQAWTSLFRFEKDYPELVAMLQAYVQQNAQSSGAHVMDLPEEFESHKVAADALLIAASYLAKIDPQTTSLWFADLAARPLHEENLIRIDCIAASRLPYGPVSDAALLRLLAQAQKLREWPLLIRESFAPVGVGWVLLHDRLAEQLLLSQVLQGKRPVQDLRLLLIGWVEDDVLAAAAEYATSTDLQLALALERRRAVHLPLAVETHEAVIRIAEQLGDDQLVEQEGAIVARLSPPQ